MATQISHPLVSQHAQDVIDTADKDSTAILAAIVDSVVDTDDDYGVVAGVLKTVKSMSNELEATRMVITQPINANLREINKAFALPQARLDIIEKRLKYLISSYAAKKQAEQQALLVKAAEAAKSAQSSASDDARVIIQHATVSVAPAVSGVSFSERWSWRAVDISLVPREYLMVDDAKVTAAVRAGTRAISGISIFPMPQTRVVAAK